MQPLKSFTLNSNHILAIAISITLIYGVTQILWGEKIPVNDGCGWDGKLYCKIAQEFEYDITHKQLLGYHVQRSAPIAVVHFLLRTFEVPLIVANIIRGFEIYNLVLLLVSVSLWHLIAQEIKLKTVNVALGYVLLFVNWAFLKFYFYYPVLTDSTAFALGMLMTLSFLKKQGAGILLLMLIGNFAWPTFFVFGATLYLFPFKSMKPEPASSHFNIIFAFGATAIAAVLFLSAALFAANQTWVNTFSAIVALLYIFTVTRYILDSQSLFQSQQWLKSEYLKRLLILGSMTLALKWVVAALESGMPPDPISTLEFFLFDSLTRHPIQMPLIFWITHAFAFGLIIFLVSIFFRSFCHQVHEWGLGATLFVVMTLAYSVDWESRHIVHALPLVVAALLKSINSINWRTVNYAIMAVLAIVISRFWIPFGATEADYNQPLSFPALNYAMYFPESIHPIIYAGQITVIVLVGVILYLLFRQSLKRSSNQTTIQFPQQ